MRGPFDLAATGFEKGCMLKGVLGWLCLGRGKPLPVRPTGLDSPDRLPPGSTKIGFYMGLPCSKAVVGCMRRLSHKDVSAPNSPVPPP